MSLQQSRAALIMIDMQHGFIDSDSPLCIRDAAASVHSCAAALAAARDRGVPVFHVNRLYREDGSDVELARAQVWARGGKPLTPGSHSAEPPRELAPFEGEYLIIKPRYSAFFHTNLDLLLRRLGADTVVLTGTTTPNCIRATCYDALSLDYNVLIITDCCSSQTAEIQRANMEDMARAGARLITVAEFPGWLAGV